MIRRDQERKSEKVQHHSRNYSGDTNKKNKTLRLADTQLKQIKTVSLKVEEVQDLSICASIEKDLPQISRLAEEPKEQSTSFIEKIIQEKRLKDQALQKAEAMINLLKQDNNDLVSEINYLRSLCQQKDRLIEAMEFELNEFRQPITHRQAQQSLAQKSITSISKFNDDDSQNKQPKDYFSFSQSKDRLKVRKSQKKIMNIDHPAYKDYNNSYLSDISKKFTPYASNLIQSNQNQPALKINNLLQNISLLLIKDEVEKNKILTEEMKELLIQEQEEQIIYEDNFQQKIKQLEETQLFQYQGSDAIPTVTKRLFTLQTERIQTSNSISQVLVSYQKCIQNYKEYAAYLKAHLCQCINYINQHLIESKKGCLKEEKVIDTRGLGHLVKIIVEDVKDKIQAKLNDLRFQNKELKHIMDEMIKNLEIWKKAQPKFEEWVDYSYVMKELQ